MSDDVKMVIVMRDKYPDGRGGTMSPRKGKMIAQAGHAVSHFLIDAVNRHILQGANAVGWNEVETRWFETGTKKICVRVQSEEELVGVHEKALAAGLVSHLVIDSGLTEFEGPTKTCLAIGPDYASKIDLITGGLGLL